MQRSNHKLGIAVAFLGTAGSQWIWETVKKAYPTPTASERAMLQTEAERVYADSGKLIHPFLEPDSAKHLRQIEWRFGMPTRPPEVEHARMGASGTHYTIRVKVDREKGEIRETIVFSPYRGLSYWSGPTDGSAP